MSIWRGAGQRDRSGAGGYAAAVPRGTLLRPKEGESACGDQLAVFTAGAMLYMLLSDGMGSGAEVHARKRHDGAAAAAVPQGGASSPPRH